MILIGKVKVTTTPHLKDVADARRAEDKLLQEITNGVFVALATVVLLMVLVIPGSIWISIIASGGIWIYFSFLVARLYTMARSISADKHYAEYLEKHGESE